MGPTQLASGENHFSLRIILDTASAELRYPNPRRSRELVSLLRRWPSGCVAKHPGSRDTRLALRRLVRIPLAEWPAGPSQILFHIAHIRHSQFVLGLGGLLARQLRNGGGIHYVWVRCRTK